MLFVIILYIKSKIYYNQVNNNLEEAVNIRDVLDKSILTKDDLLFLMKVEKEEEIQEIYKKAYEIKKEFIGQKVY